MFIKLLGGAFTIHLLVGVGLYAWAVQVNPDSPINALGRWLLASDAIDYHHYGRELASYWSSRSNDPVQGAAFSGSIGSFIIVVAGLYSAFGPTPMAVIGFNALLVIPLGLGARHLALAVGQDRTAARILALLICLWPPALAWSSVILREIPCYAMIIWVMTLVIRLADDQGPFFRRPKVWVQMAVLLVLIYLVFSIRWYLGRTFVPLIGLVLLWSVLRAGPPPVKLRRLGRAMMIYLVVVVSGTLGAMYSLKILALRLTIGVPAAKVAAAPGEGLPLRLLRTAFDIIVPSWPELNERRREYMTTDQEVSNRRAARIRRESGAASSHRKPGAVSRRQPDLAPRSSYQYHGVLVRLLIFPYPWDNWPKSQSNSPVRFLILAQSVFWYLLLPGLALGVVVRLKGLSWTTIFVVGWLLILGLALAYVVANLGGLYRLRDLAILPALVLVDLRPYRWLWRRARFRRRRHQESAADNP
ncbi:MAG: hypothetical protein KKC37_06725 [Proteobacteria bacterium]|nr:hypothetical protein [Pseudomonadota bacterium]